MRKNLILNIVDDSKNDSENIHEHFAYPSVVTPSKETLLIKTCFPGSHPPCQTPNTTFQPSSPRDTKKEELEKSGEESAVCHGTGTQDIVRYTQLVETNQKKGDEYKRENLNGLLRRGRDRSELAVNCKRFQKVRRYILDRLCRLPPSIPTAPNFGYLETYDGRLKALKPERIYHTGKGEDKIGPGHYTPQPLNRTEGTNWHVSKSKREIFPFTKNKVVGPGSYLRKENILGNSQGNPSYYSTFGSGSFASQSKRFVNPPAYKTVIPSHIQTVRVSPQRSTTMNTSVNNSICNINNNALKTDKSQTTSIIRNLIRKNHKSPENKREEWQEVIRFIHNEAAKSKPNKCHFRQQLGGMGNIRREGIPTQIMSPTKVVASHKCMKSTGFMSTSGRFFDSLSSNNNTLKIEKYKNCQRAISTSNTINNPLKLGAETITSMSPSKGSRNANLVNKYKTENDKLFDIQNERFKAYSSFKLNKPRFLSLISDPIRATQKLNNLMKAQTHRVISTKKINKAFGISLANNIYIGICNSLGLNAQNI